MKQIYHLTFKDCQKINTAIQNKHSDDIRGISVAIVDSHGELLSFFRTDNSSLSSIQIAMNKAFTAVRDRQRSSSLKENSKKYDFPITDLGDLRYTGLSGGVPIVFKDEYIGAVAVSGLSQEEDEELAISGINALLRG